MSLVLLFGVGVLTGVTTVLFGFGGGFVTVPAVYVLAAASGNSDSAMHTAVATSTAVMIVNAGSATVASARQGRLAEQYLWPITLFIAVGAGLGAYAAILVPGYVLHWLFVVYIAVTIADCLLRSGFVTRSGPREPLSATQKTLGGTLIGCVASFLGVGGSVLTVPLLRRKGVDMATATAMANPLSLPVAVVGSLVYAFAGPVSTTAGEIGHINLIAAASLLAGSLPTIAGLKRILAGRAIPDRVHAVMYVALLGLVLVAMVLHR
ncbi:putative membrane protein YfcA [Mycobacterium sp. MAA66]|uniref:sulfite exporter TauE/SafE family protein n=1 Tax=Mycobacterium sp. MAA66 TaxID=3156297 RepID=UPI0035189572